MLKPDDFPSTVADHLPVMPEAYQAVFARGLTNIDPWYFLEAEEARGLAEALLTLYPASSYLPFARRRDNDDVACLIPNPQQPKPSVAVVHAFASPGWEVDVIYADFWAWFREAVDDMIEVETNR